MIAKKKSDPKSDHGKRKTIEDLIQAALNGELEKARILLEEGADVNSADPTTGYTCLHIAAAHGDLGLLDILLDHNRQHGDLLFTAETRDPPRQAWQIAMRHQHFKLAEMLDPLTNQTKGPDSPKLVI